MSVSDYAVSFRGLPACPCQVEWIPAFEAHLRRVLPGFMGTLSLAQLIGGAPQSGGTHADGGVSDFWVFGSMADKVVAEARKMGADPTWHRQAGWDGPGSDEHVHCVLRGCPHLSSGALVQVGCVDRNDDGLVGDAPDSGPRPLSYRTWREGIEWAEEQEMGDYAATLDRIEKALANSRTREIALRKQVKALADLVMAQTEKNSGRITKAKKELLAAINEGTSEDE